MKLDIGEVTCVSGFPALGNQRLEWSNELAYSQVLCLPVSWGWGGDAHTINNSTAGQTFGIATGLDYLKNPFRML